MKKLLLALIAAVILILAATATVRACDSDWGNDQYSANDYE